MKDFSPYNIVSEALVCLRENERKVVSGRFGIASPRQTLSMIGKSLGLSRERVRQIEREGLRRLAGAILEKHRGVTAKMVEVFEKSGGVAVGHKMAEKFLAEAYQGDVNQFNSLNLILFILPEIRRIKKTRELEEGWILAKIQREEAVKVINEWVSHLNKTSVPATLDVLLKAHPHHQQYEVAFLSELPSISKKIIKTDEGQIGLSSWSEINPKNVRDKIYYILKRSGHPLHFEEIARRIAEQNFDKKRIVRATVHNELIADERFVLVGRGIYALAEWGYDPGTVMEVIIGILAQAKEGMATEDIIQAVLKKRVVKRNTILINLKTRPQFKRLRNDRYVLA
ncbi:MAG: sigma factor-like helix-turn-helix DNA-binding protein [Patescibacteria group bacterium]